MKNNKPVDIDISRLRELDQQTIGKVYDQYFPDVFKYILYRLGDKTLAEDIASEVFMFLLEAIHSKKGPDTNVHGWLISTASHKVNDHFRRHYRRPEEQLKETTIETLADPGSQVELDEHFQVLREAISKLTNEQQHILTLRFGQGYSLEETANIMDKKVNAIKALQFRAIKALNRKIEKNC